MSSTSLSLSVRVGNLILEKEPSLSRIFRPDDCQCDCITGTLYINNLTEEGIQSLLEESTRSVLKKVVRDSTPLLNIALIPPDGGSPYRINVRGFLITPSEGLNSFSSPADVELFGELWSSDFGASIATMQTNKLLFSNELFATLVGWDDIFKPWGFDLSIVWLPGQIEDLERHFSLLKVGGSLGSQENPYIFFAKSMYDLALVLDQGGTVAEAIASATTIEVSSSIKKVVFGNQECRFSTLYASRPR